MPCRGCIARSPADQAIEVPLRESITGGERHGSEPILHGLGKSRDGLSVIVILSFLLERALAPFFESRLFIGRLKKKGMKEMIAVILGALICIVWQFDAISVIVLKDSMTLFGEIITGAVIAGGSKASIKLFRDVLGFKSTAQDEVDEKKKENKKEEK